MTQRIFLDTNILIDLVTEKIPFSDQADQLLAIIDEYNIEVYASALSIANIAFFVTKLRKKPHDIVSKLLQWIKITDLNREVIDHAVVSKFSDFEDGLQYFSAISVKGIEAIITRNKKDFILSQIPVFTPTEFVKEFIE